ncbi:hypothetical protein GGI35DRAFT_143702 [Trichoderma velutinum]
MPGLAVCVRSTVKPVRHGAVTRQSLVIQAKPRSRCKWPTKLFFFFAMVLAKEARSRRASFTVEHSRFRYCSCTVRYACTGVIRQVLLPSDGGAEHDLSPFPSERGHFQVELEVRDQSVIDCLLVFVSWFLSFSQRLYNPRVYVFANCAT